MNRFHQASMAAVKNLQNYFVSKVLDTANLTLNL